jgi:hypothetical protein
MGANETQLKKGNATAITTVVVLMTTSGMLIARSVECRF